jgi:hypothetical protein
LRNLRLNHTKNQYFPHSAGGPSRQALGLYAMFSPNRPFFPYAHSLLSI